MYTGLLIISGAQVISSVRGAVEESCRSRRLDFRGCLSGNNFPPTLPFYMERRGHTSLYVNCNRKREGTAPLTAQSMISDGETCTNQEIYTAIYTKAYFSPRKHVSLLSTIISTIYNNRFILDNTLNLLSICAKYSGFCFAIACRFLSTLRMRFYQAFHLDHTLYSIIY